MYNRIKYPDDLSVMTLYRLQLKNGDRVNVVFTSKARYADMRRKMVYSIPEWVNIKRCSVKDHLEYVAQRDKVITEYVMKGYIQINERDLLTPDFWMGMGNVGIRKNI